MSDWAPPQWFPELDRCTVALDTETFDPDIDLRGPGWAPGIGHVVGYSLATPEWSGYWPIRHGGGGNLDPDLVHRWLADQLRKPSVTWVVHNGLYDLGWLRREGLPVPERVHDTAVAAPLINEYRESYKLHDVSVAYGGPGKDETRLRARAKELKLNPKRDLHLLPAADVGPYAEQDAIATLDLWARLEPLLHEEDVWRVYSELEMPLQPLLLEMRWRGIRVDVEAAVTAARELETREKRIRRELRKALGFDLEEWNQESLARAFDKLGLTYHLTPKTKKPSFRKGFLEGVEHPICRQILDLRNYNKLRTTFVEGYVVNKHVDGRIFPQLNPLRSEEGGAVSGRFSSSNPNSQNLPNPEKDPWGGKLIRGLFLPEEGARWAACDYSQQEPRVAVHFAALAGVRGAQKAVNAYVNDPNTDFHQMVADLAGIPRKQAKIINLAQMYGQGPAALCRALGLPTTWIERYGRKIEVAGEEGQAIIDQYNQRVPWVRGLSDECQRLAKRRGYIRTLLGRRCRFHPDGENGYAYPYKAMNRLVQGSSADQTKKAMLEMWRERVIPLTQVHDEIALNDYDVERGERIMVECTPLRVPSKVDVAYGANWGEAA